MLVDDLITAIRDPSPGATPEITAAIRMMADKASSSLLSAQRFVLSPKVCAAVDDMIDPQAVRASLPHLFLPALKTWLEWDDSHLIFGGGRVGVLIEGKDVYSGTVYCYTRHGIKKGGLNAALYEWEAEFDFRGDDSNMFTPDGKLKASVDGSIEGLVPIYLTWIWTALAIINTSRVAEHRPADLSRLNKSRGTRPPLLSYKDVCLTVDTAPIRTVVPHGGDVVTGQRPYHHVRTHMRLRAGRVQIVKPHWRGNKEKGVVKQRHIVRVEGDKRGKWEGGPLPPPIILKPKDKG